MRDPCHPAFPICIRGGVEEEGGFWWEIRTDDSPGTKSAGINQKLTKSTQTNRK